MSTTNPIGFLTEADVSQLARQVLTAGGTKAPVIVRVNCLIYGSPGSPGEPDYTIVLNSYCSTADAVRLMLHDRLANGEAFPLERCATVPMEEYNRANPSKPVRS